VSADIHGTVAPGYERVRDAFAANFAERGDTGASVAVVAGGQPVVHLWGGWADRARTQPWQPDTLTNVWSTTKAMTALCALVLIDRGELDPDAPVARYWPEFAAAGKADIPVRWVLSHRAGLAALSQPVTQDDLLDWAKMTGLLAAQAPLWPPGTISGYHSVTFGYLVGEVVRRVTGQSLGRFFATEVAGPLAADFHIGLAEADLARCAQLHNLPAPAPGEPAGRAARLGAADLSGYPALAAALGQPATRFRGNDRGWRMAEIPAANGHGTALALATILGAAVDGAGRLSSGPPSSGPLSSHPLSSHPLIGAGTLAAARTGQGRCTDLVLGIPMDWGLGFALSGPEGHFGPNPAAFGHDGAGGSAVCADPEVGFAFSYVMNGMAWSLVDDQRKMSLLDAVYASVR
jgi:CubicO group peptidase (beta-lactamase class C family)